MDEQSSIDKNFFVLSIRLFIKLGRNIIRNDHYHHKEKDGRRAFLSEVKRIIIEHKYPFNCIQFQALLRNSQ